MIFSVYTQITHQSSRKKLNLQLNLHIDPSQMKTQYGTRPEMNEQAQVFGLTQMSRYFAHELYQCFAPQSHSKTPSFDALQPFTFDREEAFLLKDLKAPKCK